MYCIFLLRGLYCRITGSDGKLQSLPELYSTLLFFGVYRGGFHLDTGRSGCAIETAHSTDIQRWYAHVRVFKVCPTSI